MSDGDDNYIKYYIDVRIIVVTVDQFNLAMGNFENSPIQTC